MSEQGHSGIELPVSGEQELRRAGRPSRRGATGPRPVRPSALPVSSRPDVGSAVRCSVAYVEGAERGGDVRAIGRVRAGGREGASASRGGEGAGGGAGAFGGAGGAGRVGRVGRVDGVAGGALGVARGAGGDAGARVDAGALVGAVGARREGGGRVGGCGLGCPLGSWVGRGSGRARAAVDDRTSARGLPPASAAPRRGRADPPDHGGPCPRARRGGGRGRPRPPRRRRGRCQGGRGACVPRGAEVTITIAAPGTVWDVADGVAPGASGPQRAALVDRIVEANALTSLRVSPGEVLRVPL